LHKNQIKRRSL